MTTDQRQRWCAGCNTVTLHARHRASDSVGCLITLLTCGLWLPVWLIVSAVGTATPYRCQRCGGKAK